MERNKAFICGVMLARSNVGFGLPDPSSVRQCVHNSRHGRFAHTILGLSEAMIGERNGDGAVEYVADEAEGWVNSFLLDSYTDEQFEKDYPDAAKLYELASITSAQVEARFNTLFNSAQTVGFAHVPETQKEFEVWLSNQASGNPSAGVYAMVGFNYAMRQVRKMIDGETPPKEGL